jgi:copper chaperone
MSTTGTVTVSVAGMTCGHCVRSVTEELTALPGVTDVRVALTTGATSTVTFTAAEPLSDEDIRAAIDEAGYQVVG